MTEGPWIVQMGRPLVVGVLTTLVALVTLPVLFGATAVGHDRSLPLFCGVVALEAMLSARVLQSDGRSIVTPLYVRLLEIVSIAVCRQLWVPLFGGTALLWTGFPRLHFSAILLSIVAILPLAGAWLIGTCIASAYRDLDTGQRQAQEALTPAAELGLWVLAGSVLVTAGGLLARIHLPGDRTAHGNLAPAWMVVLYAILALAVLSDVRYSSLRPRWGRRPMPVTPAFNRAWLRYGSILGAVALALALLLPLPWQGAVRPISVGPLQHVFTGWSISTGARNTDLPDAVPDYGSASRPSETDATGHSSSDGPSSGPPLPSLFTLPIGGIGAALGFGLPWLIVLAGLGYRVRRRRFGDGGGGGILDYVTEVLSGCARAILALACFLTRRPARTERSGTIFPSRASRSDVDAPIVGRFIRLTHRRTPAERVVAAYRSVVRRAESERLLRAPGHSPRTLVQVVADTAPDQEATMVELAGRYVEARYGRRAIDPTAAREAGKRAGRIRRALRHK